MPKILVYNEHDLKVLAEIMEYRQGCAPFSYIQRYREVSVSKLVRMGALKKHPHTADTFFVTERGRNDCRDFRWTNDDGTRRTDD